MLVTTQRRAQQGNLEVTKVAQVSVRRQFFERLYLRKEAKLVRDAARRAGGFCRLEHRLRVGRAQRERLLAEHVFTGRERSENVAGVSERGRRNRYNIERTAGEHLLTGAKGVRKIGFTRDRGGARR